MGPETPSTLERLQELLTKCVLHVSDVLIAAGLVFGLFIVSLRKPGLVAMDWRGAAVVFVVLLFIIGLARFFV